VVGGVFPRGVTSERWAESETAAWAVSGMCNQWAELEQSLWATSLRGAGGREV